MKIYVINLPHRQDRRDEFLKSNNIQAEFEWFDGTVGADAFPEEQNKFMRGHLGCWDSHLRLLKKIKESVEEIVMVLEDDCVFTTENLGMELLLLARELPGDWDLLYLGGDNKGERKPYSEHLDIAETIYQTHAYIIRRKFLDTLIETLEGYPYKVDVVFSNALPKGKCFIINPPIALQRESFSDITLK